MASTQQSNDDFPVDLEEELTKPEARPAVRAPAGASSQPGPTSASAADELDEEEEVTKVDPKRQQLVQSEPLPPDLVDLDV